MSDLFNFEDFQMDPDITLEDMEAALGWAAANLSKAILFDKEKEDDILTEKRSTGRKYSALEVAHILTQMYGACRAEITRNERLIYHE